MHAHYGKLALTLSINAVLMFLIGYVMIDRLDHFYANINAVYMTLLMVAPMAILMLLVMRSMFPNVRLNVALHAGFALLFIGVFLLTRTQTPVDDIQFLRSMIPHHSSAILMCEQSSITNPEIVALCDEIVQSQREEIEQMQAILARY